MIRLFLFLMTIESKLRKKEEKYNFIKVKFGELQRQRNAYQTKDPSLGNRIGSAFKNIGNVALNGFDNTVGYGVAKYQNSKTRKHLKGDPNSKRNIVYLMHGLLQNEGSQWRFAKQLRKSGYEPYHLKGNHDLKRSESVDKAFEQIKGLHKKTKLKNPSKRYDVFSGHSSGADVGLYMAGDERIKKYGIKEVQARAPAPYGIKAKTWPQRLLMPLIGEKDDLEGKVAQREAVEMAGRDPKINVHVVAGKYDRLVTPRDVAYKKHPKIKHYLIPDKNSTHFGTSGANKGMNEVFVDLIKKGKDKYKTEYRRTA